MSFVDLISAATQPTNSSSNPSTEALISLAAAFGALLALGKTAIEFLQARIKPSAANTPPVDAETAGAIVSLETTEIVLYSRSSWVMMWVGYLTLALAGASYGVYYLWYWFTVERSYLIGAVSILVGALLAMMGLDRVHQLWEGRSYGNPLSSCEASVVVEGDFPKVFARCKKALTALQAIKARGSKIEVRENWGLLEGGTGAWPHPSGERVSLRSSQRGGTISQLSKGTCTARCQGVAYYHEERLLLSRLPEI